MPRMRFTILLLAIALLFIASAIYYLFKPVPHKISYLAMGDSFTFSTNIRYDENFPSQLCGYLRGQGVDIGHPVFIAHPGWRSGDLCKAVQKKNLRDTFTFVTLFIGFNNQFRRLDFQTYRPQFAELLTKALGYVNGHAERVFVLSLPNWSASPFAGGRDRNQIAVDIADYNAAIKEMTLGNRCQYVDISEILHEHALDPSLFMEDFLHPSPKGYSLWVAKMGPVIAGALNKLQLQ